MVTNEEMILSFPEEALRAIEPSCGVESFESNFDSQDRWLLLSPFDAPASGIAPGMVVRIAISGLMQSPILTFVIDSVTPSGFVLRNAGQPANLGRGPGALFGMDMVRAKILDMRPNLEQAESIVDARFGTLLPGDAPASAMKAEAIKTLAFVRMANDTEYLKAFMGSVDSSLQDFENRVLEKLGSDLLIRLSRVKGGAMSWPRVSR